MTPTQSSPKVLFQDTHTPESVLVAIYNASSKDQIRNARSAWATLDGARKWDIYEALKAKESELGLIWNKIGKHYSEPVKTDANGFTSVRKYNFATRVAKTENVTYNQAHTLFSGGTVNGKTLADFCNELKGAEWGWLVPDAYQP